MAFTKIHLCSGWDTLPTQLVFGELANLAWPILTHYRSDLYHDAQWLAANLDVNVPFYYGIRPTGTDLGFDKILGKGIGERKNYRCELIYENETHYLTVNEVN